MAHKTKTHRGITPISATTSPVEIFDDKKAAAYIGIQPRTLRAWRNSRQLPFLRVTARVIRFRKSDLDAWLDRTRTAMTGGAA